jgi:hypothetical protein
MTASRLLDRLDEVKSRFGPAERKLIEQLLASLSRVRLGDASELLRFHEALLFLSAYPQSSKIKKVSESLLNSFPQRVAALRAADVDLSGLEPPDVSGIAGLVVSDTFSFYIVRWLVERQSNRLTFDWEYFEDENRLAETWPRFMPLLEDDAAVEANVPYREWLRNASGSERREVRWLIGQFDKLPIRDKKKAELYDSQKLYVTWLPSQRESRTGLRLPARNVYYHRGPLIQRKEVSLRRELENRPPKMQLLNTRQGAAALDLARAASTVRYRELYGFTHGDPRRVFKVDLGRGVDLLVSGLPPEKRLPLRAYHAAMIFKNGVPVGYFEGLSLFERMESGFNLYYTFRDGETAWLYARLLNVFRPLLGVTAFSIDPYQVGFENEEGIESGAFWFYRKLGFRSTNREVMKLVEREEEKIARAPGYRTPARTLRKLAESSMIFELDQTRRGDWDKFQTRNIGLKMQKEMAARHGGDASSFRNWAIARLARALKLSSGTLNEPQQSALADFAVTLAQSNVASWTDAEKHALAKVIKAKTSVDEGSYLKVMQRHTRLREVVIKLGS